MSVNPSTIKLFVFDEITVEKVDNCCAGDDDLSSLETKTSELPAKLLLLLPLLLANKLLF